MSKLCFDDQVARALGVEHAVLIKILGKKMEQYDKGEASTGCVSEADLLGYFSRKQLNEIASDLDGIVECTNGFYEISRGWYLAENIYNIQGHN